MLPRRFPALAAGAPPLRPHPVISLLCTSGRARARPPLPVRKRLDAITWHRPYASYGSPRPRPSFDGYQYRRFTSYRAIARTNFILWWAVSPGFRRFTYFVGGGTLCFVGCSMERTPVTGRWRFNCIPSYFIEQIGEDLYKQRLREFGDAVLPESAWEVQRLRRILERLVSCNGLPSTKEQPWTVQVMRDDEAIAFILPGRHIFVSTAMLLLTQDEGSRGDDDGLATILGHEIAHIVARHAAESVSHYSALFVVACLLSVFFDVSGQFALGALELAYRRPSSRTQESEADYIGLMMMAAACYDPRAALDFWSRMAKAQTTNVAEFRSTHPSHANRIKRIRGWMDQALEKREASCCEASRSLMLDLSLLAGNAAISVKAEG